VKYREGVFLEASWIAVYLGQRILPEGHDMRAELPSPDALAVGMEELRNEIQQAVHSMPDHLRMIAQYCPMAA
jgi:tryptophan halogenase